QNRYNVLRTQRPVSPRNLVFVPTEVTPLIALIVNLVVPFEFAHVKLRREFERAFADILLRNEAFERTVSNEHANFVSRIEPSRIRLGESGSAGWFGNHNHGVNQVESAILLEAGRTQRTLVNAEGEAAISGRLFKRIRSQRGLAEFVAAGRQSNHHVLNADFRAKILDLVGAADETEMRHALAGIIPLDEQHFPKIPGDEVESLEGHRTGRQQRGELNAQVGFQSAGEQRVEIVVCIRREL